jgi:hypothetical protein
MDWNYVLVQKVGLPETLCADHTMDERWDRLRLFRLDPVGGLDQVPRFGKPSTGIVIQRAERLAAFDGVSNALVKLESHGRVNRVLLLFAPSAQHNACHAQLLALRRGDESVGWTGNVERLSRMREAPRIVNYPYVSAL